MHQLYVQPVMLSGVKKQTDAIEALNEIWEQGRCKPPSVAIRTVHNMVNRYLAVTEPERLGGLSGTNIDIIVYVSRHEDAEVFPQDIEQRFGVTRSTSSRVLALMEKKGLIARESVQRDARLKRIVLTAKSKAIVETLHSNAKQMERVLLGGLSESEVRCFMHTLEVMRTNLVATGKMGDGKRYPRLDIAENNSEDCSENNSEDLKEEGEQAK